MDGSILLFFLACTQSNIYGGFSTKGSIPSTPLSVDSSDEIDQEESNTSEEGSSCTDRRSPESDPLEREVSEQANPEDCDEPMGIRKIVPDNDASAPINTHVFVSMIGNGDDSHAVISLLDPANQRIEVTTESICYYHESDTEYHCSYMIEPLEFLEENTKYRIRILGTEYHHIPGWSYESTFRTTSSEATLSSDAPSLEILRYEERTSMGLEPCDWHGVYKYELAVELADPQEAQLSLLQIFEVNGNDEELVHSLIVPEDHSRMEFRQVLNPGTEGNRCYRALHLDVAGNESDSSPTVCWE
jgi:hypothetical protein